MFIEWFISLIVISLDILSLIYLRYDICINSCYFKNNIIHVQYVHVGTNITCLWKINFIYMRVNKIKYHDQNVQT